MANAANVDDATLIITDLLRRHVAVASHGYEVSLYEVIMKHLQAENPGRQPHDLGREYIDLSPIFYAAAWELCRRGILRPGVKRANEQVTDRGSGGEGFSITPMGRAWLTQAPDEQFIPIGPGRYEQMIAPFRDHFGPGFHERGEQAIQCYRAGAFLACCVMAGAAAESIILAAAIAKDGDEARVLKMYMGAQGRGRIENFLVGKANQHIKREFDGFMVLLKYWRDEAAHGKATKISDNEAYLALALLLRFAHFANDRWEELTRP
jgi:hypothetical protein